MGFFYNCSKRCATKISTWDMGPSVHLFANDVATETTADPEHPHLDVARLQNALNIILEETSAVGLVIT